MGVFTMEIEKLNRTIADNQKEVEKLTKQLERAKEEKANQKEYEQGLKIAIENDLRNTFEKCFDRDGLEKGYINLSLKQTRNEILQNITHSTFEYDYINSNYERILNKVKKIYENDQKAKNKILTMHLQQMQQEQQSQDIKINRYKKITTTFLILIIPILILIGIIWSYNKFAKPVFEENKNIGYNLTDTVWKDTTTNEKIPKNKIHEYLQE